MAYSGFEITESNRNKLRVLFPPKYPDFIGHHVTWVYGVDVANAELPPVGTLRVIGYCCDDSLECLVVDFEGSVFRPDGKRLHLTWSLDRSKGRKPVDSNKVLETNLIEKVSPALILRCVPKLFK